MLIVAPVLLLIVCTVSLVVFVFTTKLIENFKAIRPDDDLTGNRKSTRMRIVVRGGGGEQFYEPPTRAGVVFNKSMQSSAPSVYAYNNNMHNNNKCSETGAVHFKAFLLFTVHPHHIVTAKFIVYSYYVYVVI